MKPKHKDSFYNRGKSQLRIGLFIHELGKGAFDYRIVISMIRCNFCKVYNNCTEWVQKFKVALNPLHRIFLNLAKSYITLSYKSLKLKLRVFLAAHIVTMVTFYIKKDDSSPNFSGGRGEERGKNLEITPSLSSSSSSSSSLFI